ncbi:MAG: hypothetical protein ACI934_001614, partial [Pseudohongiellaceae bacterium]
PCTLYLVPCTLYLVPCTLHLAPCTAGWWPGPTVQNDSQPFVGAVLTAKNKTLSFGVKTPPTSITLLYLVPCNFITCTSKSGHKKPRKSGVSLYPKRRLGVLTSYRPFRPYHPCRPYQALTQSLSLLVVQQSCIQL